MRLKFIFIILFLYSPSLFAQPVEQKLKIMQKLELMQGQWAGPAWSQRGASERINIHQAENVYTKLGGQLLVIDGKGTDPVSGEAIFEAFGVISAREGSDEYQFSAYTMEGNHALAQARFEDDKLVWWFETPNGATIRYEILIIQDTWTENGYYLPNDSTRYHIFHMELQRQ